MEKLKNSIATHKRGYFIGLISIVLLVVASVLGIYFSNLKSSGEDALSSIPRENLLPSDSSASPSAKSSAKPETKDPQKDLKTEAPSDLSSSLPKKGPVKKPDVPSADEVEKKAPEGRKRVPLKSPGTAPAREQKDTTNILLIGSDARPGETRSRSDSLMVAHISEDGQRVSLISIPRDVYTEIPGHPAQKVNAAYSLGGSQLTTRTVENLLGIHIDSVAITNFDGFMSLVDVVDGITVNNPYNGCDNNQNKCWKSGNLELPTGKDALSYVRWRHGLPQGDITRAENQQRVVKALVKDLLSSGKLASPSGIQDISKTLNGSVILDSSLTNQRIMELAKTPGLRNSGSIQTVGAPIAGYAMDPVYGSIDVLDRSKLASLRYALSTDTMNSYSG